MERQTETLLEALKLALTAGAEQRLYRSGKLAGLFAGKVGAAGAAAAAALRDGLLEVVRTETRGKTVIDWVRLTPRGVDFLHEHQSPVRILQDLQNTLRANHQALPLWLAEMHHGFQGLEQRLTADAQKWTQHLEALTRRVDETLRRLEADARPLLPAELGQTYPWSMDALNYLDRRQSGGALNPCPLPELYLALTPQHPGLGVSSFHEGLRRLHERRVLRLEPAANLAELPQPEFALFDNGRVLYYAGR